MRLLTVRQPWAWAIIHGGKYAENRSWPTRVRGPVAIHAGAAPAMPGGLADQYVTEHATTDPPWRREVQQPHAGDPLHVVYGAVLGVVDLVDCHPAAGCCKPWGELLGWHFVLENPRPLPAPLYAVGRQRFWHDVDILAEVRRRLEPVRENR